jgi:hypothetical protein
MATQVPPAYRRSATPRATWPLERIQASACKSILRAEMDGDTLKDLLENARFGARVAEDEVDDLASYFVETNQWKRPYSGEKDVVLGPKGAGKSALYSLVVQKGEDLLDRNILVVPAENPEGTPVFEAVAAEPPTSEAQFEGLWKLYVLSLVGSVLAEWKISTRAAKDVYAALEGANLLQPKASLGKRLQAVRAYVARFFQPKAIETSLAIDPNTGVHTMTGRITLGEPSADESDAGSVSLDEMLRKADEAMTETDVTIWIVLDRLDVAFARNEELETNALRALFAAYLDMKGLKRVSLKVFLRSDIWDRVTEGKFAEGSHIDEEIIEWESQGLRQLMLRRVLKNQDIAEFYGVEPDQVFNDVGQQEALIKRLLPDQIDSGNNPKTFDWMLTRTQDGSGKTAPRELIHLLTSLRERQIRRLEQGHSPPPDENLFDRAVFKEALGDVSEARLKKTLFSEFPDVKPYVEKLRDQKAEQRVATLAPIWGISVEAAREVADRLAALGFFTRSGPHDNPSYWAPFLYRPAAGLVQGAAKLTADAAL